MLSLGAALVLAAMPARGQTTTTPTDYRGALTTRLAHEYGDDELATQVVAGLGADTVAQLEARIPLADVATSPLFTYRPQRAPQRSLDSVVAFSFGYRLAPDGSIEPGPTNEALAKAVEKLVRKHPMPVYAQHEIAQVLEADGVRDVTSIEPLIGPDGIPVYLSTAGVAEQIVQRAAEAGVDLGRSGVVCFADHVQRCVLTAEAAGLDATVPKKLVLPSTYDPQSEQSWTRDRASYLATDLVGRIATL